MKTPGGSPASAGTTASGQPPPPAQENEVLGVLSVAERLPTAPGLGGLGEKPSQGKLGSDQALTSALCSH